MEGHEESAEDAVVRLLADAHAEAQAGNLEGALETALVAIEELKELV